MWSRAIRMILSFSASPRHLEHTQTFTIRDSDVNYWRLFLAEKPLLACKFTLPFTQSKVSSRPHFLMSITRPINMILLFFTLFYTFGKHNPLSSTILLSIARYYPPDESLRPFLRLSHTRNTFNHDLLQPAQPVSNADDTTSISRQA